MTSDRVFFWTKVVLYTACGLNGGMCIVSLARRDWLPAAAQLFYTISCGAMTRVTHTQQRVMRQLHKTYELMNEVHGALHRAGALEGGAPNNDHEETVQ